LLSLLRDYLSVLGNSGGLDEPTVISV
jgi:hypothetical protein